MTPLVILSIENDDDRAFMEELYLSYRRLMFSELWKTLHNEDDVNDVQQDCIIRLMGKIPLLRALDRDKLVNYIITTCRHSALNFIRSENHTRQYAFDEGFDALSDMVSPSEDRLLRAERREDILSAWQALDEKSRRVLELKYVLEADNAMIAQEFGVGEASVRMLLTRARSRFKKLLDGEEK